METFKLVDCRMESPRAEGVRRVDTPLRVRRVPCAGMSLNAADTTLALWKPRLVVQTPERNHMVHLMDQHVVFSSVR